MLNPTQRNAKNGAAAYFRSPTTSAAMGLSLLENKEWTHDNDL